MNATNTESDLEAKLAIATEALRKAEERAIAGQLALELMHELRNPLEALGNLSYLAWADSDIPEKVRAHMHLAEEQLVTLNQLVNQTLGFARSTYDPKAINLILVVEAALRVHQRAIEHKKIHLVKDFHGGITAEVRPAEILQVFSNLVVNALDALSEEGVLCFRVRKRGDEIHVVIADNGHGIQPEDCREMFKPFFTTKGDLGTGLGLAISKKIIERHRGKIRLRSGVRPGKSGTTFKISLPIQSRSTGIPIPLPN